MATKKSKACSVVKGFRPSCITGMAGFGEID